MALEPCPFCRASGDSIGVQATLPPAADRLQRRYQVICMDCGASGPRMHHEQAARGRWNVRYPLPETKP